MKLHILFNDYLRAKYGCKVYKVSIDAGFTCPTRDGTISSDGCIYCDEAGSRAAYCDRTLPINEQVSQGLALLKRKYRAKKFIAYFQAFTNTYAPPAELKKIYDQAFISDEIIGLSIGTRPDCINNEVLDIIEPFASKYEVWIELGIQSLNDKTLRSINRGHTSDISRKAIKLIKRRSGIKICAHMIIGLPGENPAGCLNTAKELSELGIDGIKIHCFHILKGTLAERLYNEGKIKLLDQDEYVRAVRGVLKNLRPDIIIQRLTGEAPADRLIAPAWVNNKTEILKLIKSP